MVTRHAHRFASIVLAAIIAVSMAFSPAAGQIEITKSFYENRIGTAISYNWFEASDPTQLQSVVNATGPGATYDFTGASWDSLFSGTNEYQSMTEADVPGSDRSEYANATYVVSLDWSGTGDVDQDSTAWQFMEMRDDAIHFAGFTYAGDFDDDQEEDTLAIYHDPYIKETRLPLQYQATWEDSTTQTIETGSGSISQEIEESSEVTGYGELVLPQGSAPALRIRTTTVTYNQLTQTRDTSVTIGFVTKQNIGATIRLTDQNAPEQVTYYYETGTSTAAPALANVPEQFRLEPNYPNPFNPSTTISYALPRASEVRLTVVDLLGRRVRTLVDERQSAGRHAVAFDAAGLSSGLYLYRIRAGSWTSTRQMSLLK